MRSGSENEVRFSSKYSKEVKLSKTIGYRVVESM